jgi:chromosome segregation ATPase
MTDRLMAALQDELAGRERKTEERVRAESKVTQELFEEACSEINNTKARLAAMVDQLTALREDHATQLRARDDELTKVRDQASKLESRLEIAEKIRNEAILQFNSMQLNHGVIQERLTNTAEDLARAEKEIGTLRDCLKNAERDRDEARKTAADHDQRAILLTWQVDHKDEENAHLKKELAEASLRAANAEARLELLGSGGSKPEAKVGQKQQEGRARN